MPTSRRCLLALVALTLLACAPPERTRVTECIAPAAAGGGWDMTCRLMVQVLRQLELTGGSARTVNLPGAGGGVAYAHAVGQRNGDPHVLVAASPGTSLRLAQGQYGPLQVDDVRWIGALGAEYGIVAVAADAPWATLAELLADWRERPGEIVVSGGSAVAGQDHLKMLLVGRAGGVDPRTVRYVPFDGGGEALTALLGGFVHVFSGDASEIESHVEAGSVRVLGVLAPERVQGILSDSPTAREQGFDVEWVTWRGYFIPGGVPDEVYHTWVARLDTVAASPEWAEALGRTGLRPWHRTGREFEDFVYRQVEDFRGLAREIGLVR